MSVAASLPQGTSGMTAMELSVSEAATQAGVSKSTLLRAIRRGRISATRGEVYGTFTLDPSEVARVFQPRHTAQHAAGIGAAGATDPVEMRVHYASTEAQVQALREMLQELRSDRDAWRSQAERLLLASPSPLVTPPPPPTPPTLMTAPPRTPWWRWWRHAS